uniref:Uncharacterized protein n=1 Tax=Moniliophthora roreri TaxID=221103 RepID=A0A0W0FDP0_MONRR
MNITHTSTTYKFQVVITY